MVLDQTVNPKYFNMARTFTLEKEQLPSKLYSITFREPNYGDYRQARKRYPVERYAGDPSAKVSYSLEELLFAMCMEKIDGQDLLANPRDISERLAPFPIPDRQFLLTLFLELFFISRDHAQSARDLAEKLSTQPVFTFDIGKHELPTGKVGFGFRAPNTGTQMEVDRRYQGPSQNGCSLEEMLFAYCLQSINGDKIELPKDTISILDDWDIVDVQWASTLFINMFTIDDEQSQEAKKLAKSLKENLLVQSGESKAPTTTRRASAAATES